MKQIKRKVLNWILYKCNRYEQKIEWAFMLGEIPFYQFKNYMETIRRIRKEVHKYYE